MSANPPEVLPPSAPDRRRVALRVIDARPEPAPRFGGILERLERPFLAAERLVDRYLPERFNPLVQTGAIANTTFLIAVVTGILLLFWYVPSVQQAYDSLEDMRAQPFGAQLVRSLHRYSSDACMLFVILHAMRYTFARRFGGPRWLAWVTGTAALVVLWAVGWLGYWLVWDQRGQQVAVGTARILDVLPIFAEPLGRSFLVDETVNTLLFFVIFFMHMIIPMLIGVALWLHITRLSRPKFLTDRPMTVWVSLSLVIVSLIWPALSVEPAVMLETPQAFSMDFWYLMPLAFTDRLSGGLLWLVFLLPGAVLLPLPWWASRARVQAATVTSERCNACQKCSLDCPYGAISMVPRRDGRDFETEAVVDPKKCVGCGICAGSCDTGGVGVPWMSQIDVRKQMDGFVEAACRDGEAPIVAFLCAESAGADLRIDPQTGACDLLPGYRVWALPCAGWLHPLTIERAFRHGAAGVLLVACGPSSCQFREGGLWSELRLCGEREPALRKDEVDLDKVRILRLDRGQRGLLRREAEAFRMGSRTISRSPKRSGVGKRLAVVGVMTIFGGLTLLLSDAPYVLPTAPGPELVVSFVHPGQAGQHCRPVTAEEKARMPLHMQRDEICERGRSAVRLRVTVDGERVHQASYEPGGLFGDENSVAIVRLPVAAGDHDVEVAIGDGANAETFERMDSDRLTFAERGRHVVLFDRSDGFTWH